MTLTELRTAINTAFAATTALKTLITDYGSQVNAFHNSTAPFLHILPPKASRVNRGKAVNLKFYDIEMRVLGNREQKEGSNLWTLWATLEGYGDSFITQLVANTKIHDVVGDISIDYYIDMSANSMASVLFKFKIQVDNC